MRSEEEKYNQVITDYELECGEHPVGKLVHLSTVTHAWRGILVAVTPSYFVLSNEHSVALVDSTGAISDYLANPTKASEGDEFSPTAKSSPTIRVLRSAVAWMASW